MNRVLLGVFMAVVCTCLIVFAEHCACFGYLDRSRTASAGRK